MDHHTTSVTFPFL